MSNTIYRFTRQLSIIFSTLTSIILFFQGHYFRSVGSIILLVLFFFTSVLYQKRFNVITASYLFIFINLYIVFSLVASYYDCAKIIELDSTGFKNWEKGDYYPIYFFSVFFAYLCIIVYLKYCCKTRVVRMSDISITKINVRNMYIGIILTMLIYFTIGRNDIVILPALALIIILLIIDKGRRLLHFIFLLSSLVLFKTVFFTRYYVIQIVFPAIVSYFMVSKKNEQKYSIGKLYFYFAIGICFVLFYGVVSEMIKLNIFYGGHYTLSSFISSKEKLLLATMRQIYRLFIIWIKDGGYIIYHVKKNGFYFGLSYIKSLASFLDLPYINLPQIAAEYNYSTYSQTGLLAEGYSNFGILGATLNIVFVFLFMEFLRNKFARNPSLVTLSFVAIPFTKILLDGGSLSSGVVLCVVLLIVYFINVLFHFVRYK